MPELTEIPVANPIAELPPLDEMTPERASWPVRLVTLVAIGIPFLGLLAAPFFVWGWGFGWTDMGVLLGMYIFTALGITVGFHRLFVHRSFDTYMWSKFIWAVFGSMAVQGSLFKWVAMHRRLVRRWRTTSHRTAASCRRESRKSRAQSALAH